MARADVNRLMDNLRIKLPGALDGVLQLELFNVLDEFLKTTCAWQEEIPFTTKAGETEYFVTAVGPSQIVRLMWVRNDGDERDLYVETAMPVPGTLRLRHAPDEAVPMTACVACTVSDPATREGYPYLPDWILAKWMDDVMDGVLARMMGQIAKPYSSERMAVYHARRFGNAMQRARAEVLHDNVYGGQRWTFPRGFASGRQRIWR